MLVRMSNRVPILIHIYHAEILDGSREGVSPLPPLEFAHDPCLAEILTFTALELHIGNCVSAHCAAHLYYNYIVYNIDHYLAVGIKHIISTAW